MGDDGHIDTRNVLNVQHTAQDLSLVVALENIYVSTTATHHPTPPSPTTVLERKCVTKFRVRHQDPR